MKAIEDIIKILENTSPSLGLGSVPLNSDGPIGWRVFRLNGGKPSEMFVFADGTYAGFAGKDKLFRIVHNEVEEVKKFHYLRDWFNTKKRMTLTIGKRKPVDYELESTGFVDYNW